MNYDADCEASRMGNRLISVNVTGQAQPTRFIYDGDGNLVMKIEPDGSRTLYVGGIYEVDKSSDGSVTGTKTYYPAAGAMRIDSTLYYVLKDHLGSASVVTDASGQLVAGANMRYYPFGEARFDTGPMVTDKLFTGQRQIAELGIYHHQARFYSPKLGRFLSADTVVPGYANPQSWNRYSYGLNNPSRFTDPTGHVPTEGCGDGTSQCRADPTTGEEARNLQHIAKLTHKMHKRKCAAGNSAYCDGNPVEIAAFTLTMWTGGVLAESFILGGGAATAADATLWGLQKASWKAGWKLLQACAGFSACRELTIKIRIYYPGDQGFATTPTPTTLQEGQIITRIGDATGSYASPIGTTLSQRALPFHQWNSPLTGYQVLKPIDVLSGPTQSYYGLSGGGTQYLFSQPLQYYINNGYLSEPLP